MTQAAVAPNGQRWHLSEGITAVMLNDGLHIDRPDSELQPLHCYRIEMNDATKRLMRRPGPPIEVWLPHPLETYTVRHPLPGDRIAPLGMKGTQLLSDIMKDARIPDSRRRSLRVIADSESGEIIWLEGLKRSRHHLVTGKVAYRITTATCSKTFNNEVV